jgi:hypothetical protein
MVIFKKRRHMFPYVGPRPVKAPCHVSNSLQRVSVWDDGFAWFRHLFKPCSPAEKPAAFDVGNIGRWSM